MIITRKRKQTIGYSVSAKAAPDNAEISQVQVLDLNASSTSAQLSTQSFQSSSKRFANAIEDYVDKIRTYVRGGTFSNARNHIRPISFRQCASENNVIVFRNFGKTNLNS